jgi:AcrR family transcriptional regulator
MARIADREAMVGKILMAAMKVFSNKGYHAATIEQIAMQAGVGKGTIYLYFKGKEGLTIALVENIFSEIEAGISVAGKAETLGGFVDQLRTTMMISAEQLQSIPVFFEVFGPSFSSSAVRASVSEFFNRAGGRFAEAIAKLQHRGEVASELDAAMTGRLLVSMLDGVVIHHGLFNISHQQHMGMINQAVRIFFQGLKVQDTTTPE